MKVVVIVQARMSSTRLPGKVLKFVLDRPLLSYLLERLSRVSQAQEVVVATTTHLTDQPVVECCHAYEIPVFRGSEGDVLSRYHGAAQEHHADVVVRVTADCPLLDPHLIDLMIQEFLDHQPQVDFLSNTLDRSFPRGMDVEIFTWAALDAAYREATDSYDREHVTPFIYRNGDRFCLVQYQCSDPSLVDYRLTVDESEDFTLIAKILETLYPVNAEFSLEDIVVLLQENPAWRELNENVVQK